MSMPPPPPGVGRPSFSLPPPSAVRDRAARVTEQAGRVGRPRRRYLADQRRKIGARLLPTLAVIAGLTGLLTILEALLGTSSHDTTLVGATLAVLIGAASLAVPAAQKRSVDALYWLASITSVVALLGWGVVARLTGAASSPYLLFLPLASFAIVALVPMTARPAAVIGGAGYAGLLVASPLAPVFVHVVVVVLAVSGVVLARARNKASIMTFLRIERLSAALVRMRRMQEQLVVVEKLEALRVLVGGMAHELNNALAISVASNQQAFKIAEAHGDPATIAAAVRRADGGLARIRRTVDRLRRFAMAAEGILEPADVGAMLDFALESAIGRARSGVIITREYDPSVGAIECHVAALAEALFQIARNAVEAMPGGGTITASVRNEGDRVVLAVSDEGHGIPPDQLARVFDPFYSRGRGTTSKSGLGLSAVYGLVSALGGRVDIQSAVGRGTEVAIIMPRRQHSPSARPPSIFPPGSRPPPPYGPAR